MEYELLNVLENNGFVDRVIYEYETTSTNDICKANTDIDRLLAIAELQTAGRGRMGRHWESPAGEGIWMSLLCHPDLPPECIPGITLLAGLAIAECTDALIKWPNDIIINGKKICGILTEMVTDADSKNHIICGMGINVNTDSFPEELKSKGTSLYLERGKKFSREPLIVSIIQKLTNYINEYEKTGNLSFIKKQYESLLIHMDKKVILHSLSEATYITRGIDNSGALIVEDNAGTMHTISSDEISVRGLLGYI